MPFMQQVLVNIPTIILGLIVIGGMVTLSIVGLLVVRRLIPHHKLKLHNDVAGPLFGTMGVIYAVLLAFVVIIVWENFDKTKLNVEKEVNCLEDIYRDAECFPQEFKQQVRGLAKEYARAVVDSEWRAIARGEASPQVEKILKKLWQAYSNYLPTTETEKVFFEESVRRLNELADFRTMRLIDSRTGIHPALWLVLLAGAIITIGFIFLFGAESPKVQIIMAVLLTLLISLILFTIMLMDFPFSGPITVSSDVFNQVLNL